MAEAKAMLRYVRMAPRKVRVMADMIRGQQVPKALAMLKYTPRAAAQVVEKVLRSAVANAEQKDMGGSEGMWISEAYVNGGPILKRFRPRSMGRANSIQKRTSHITIIVTVPESAAAGK